MNGLEHIITAILITVFLTLSKILSKRKVYKGIRGKYHLGVNGGYKWLGYISAILGFVIAVWMLFDKEENAFFMSFLPILIFFIPGILLLMFYYNHHLIFDEETICVISWTGKSQEIHWEDITHIKFNPVMDYLQLYSDSKKLNIHFHIVGLIEFIRLMEDKTEYNAVDLKMPIE